MPVSAKLPGYQWFRFLRNTPVRVGIYTGVCLSVLFSAWVLAANRVPFLEAFAMERNVAAVVVLCFFASLPILRFYRAPWDLLVSGLLGWSILTLVFRLLCVAFVLLDEKYGTFQVFVLGAVVYLIAATLSWIGTIIWRTRAADISHSHPSASPPASPDE